MTPISKLLPNGKLIFKPLEIYEGLGFDDVSSSMEGHIPDQQQIISRIKQALLLQLAKEDNEPLESLDITEVLERPFSTIMVLEARTSKGLHRLISKTTRSHPANKRITSAENQAVVQFSILNDLYVKFKKVEKCSVPKPILVIPDIETLVMEMVEGHLLIDEFRSAHYLSSKNGFQGLREAYYHCGRWLKKFHEFTGVHLAGAEALDTVIERIEDRLGLIEEAKNSRCPVDLTCRIRSFVRDQLNHFGHSNVLVSGRHGDFGPWNIMVGPDGITVLDFLGYTLEPIAVDILKMLMNFEDERKYLAYSRRRIEALEGSFLDGYGPLPKVPGPVLVICETLHRVCSVHASISVKTDSLHRKIDRNRCLRANLRWLMDPWERRLLWPGLD